MAADKEERTPSTGSPRRSAETEDRKAAAERTSRTTTNGGSSPGQATRRQPYLIALRQPNPLLAAAAAPVVVFGAGLPVQAVTDESGRARVGLFGEKESVRAIYVRPRANHWERLVSGPELSESGATTIRLRPLAEPSAASPGEQQRTPS